ncbi:MAG: T9SS type A sorting domain-containing protein [Bacteroidetes bacterium]|nr:T9SS type A sorting domain-containing protein [Bacteroidota bacterium]MCW5895887.1 T9SS type A sorting domain-containing protein [Bacteroidota bacterium]
MKRLLLLPALTYSLFFSTLAQHPGKELPQGIVSPQQTAAGPSYQLLNINNITTWARRDGQSNHSPTGDDGCYFPRGTRWVIYQDGILWGGIPYYDSAYTSWPTQRIRVGGSSYNIGTQAGRVIGFGSTALPSNPQDPAVRVYRIRRDYARMTQAELLRDASESFEILLADVTPSHIEQIRGAYETDWREWPVEFGAPYIERNGVPGYQPPPPFSATFTVLDLINGNYDEPGFAGIDNRIPADQVLWTVCNDLNRNLTLSVYGSEPLGLENQILVWGYKRTDGLRNAYFKRIRLINKGGVDVGGGQKGVYWLDSVFVSQWSDIDIGSFGDDLVGCDTLLQLGFGYNGNPIDLEFRKFNLPPPSVGYVLLQGPIVPGGATDTATFNFTRRPFARNLPMTSFAWYGAGSSISDPPFSYEGALRMWKVFNGYIPNASTAAWQLYPHPPGITPGKFSLSGDPVRQTGFLDGLGVAYSFPPGPRSIHVNAGPFRMAPGDTQEVFVATVAGIGADRLSSVGVMKSNARYAREAARRMFATPKPPAEPIVKVSELDGEIVLDWGSQLEKVEETESPTAVPGYEFEGYNVYQLPSDSATLADGVKIAVFDRINGIRHIYDEMPDPQTGLPIQILVQHGFDTGVRRSIRIATDSLHGGRLRNGTRYYFSVTAYNYSPSTDAIPKSLESQLNILTVQPRIPFGVQLGAKFGDTLRVTHTSGRSDGHVFPIVIDPLTGTGHEYEVRFDTSGESTSWRLINTTTNTTVIAQQANQGNLEEFKNLEGGVLLQVIGPPGGMRDWSVPSGERRITFADANMGFEGFEGSIGWNEPAFFFGNISRRTTRDFEIRNVLIRLAAANSSTIRNPDAGDNPYGGWNENNPGSDENFSYAYRYLAGAANPAARPEFAPYVVNPSPGFAYQDYKRGVPLSAWNLETNPPTRLAIGHLENNIASGLVDGKWWPPSNGTGIRNDTSARSPLEWLFVFNMPYTGSTPDPSLQHDILNNPTPVMWWIVANRRANTNFSEGDEFLILANHPNAADDVFRYMVPAPESNLETKKASAQRVGVFPNPYYAGQTDGSVMRGRFVTFNNLPPKATVRIFNLAGQAVRTLRKENESQFLEWDLKNENSWLVASGMYLCYVEMPEIGETKVLKLAVIQGDFIPSVK